MDRDAIIAAMIFGGSGSGGLPAVTSADNGKVLEVANGAWGAGKADLQVNLTLNMTDPSNIIGTADKTCQEIYEAYQAGKSISVRYNSGGVNFVGMIANATLSSGVYSVFAVLLNHTFSTNYYVMYLGATSGLNAWTGQSVWLYSKPSTGIPKGDMATAIYYPVTFTISGQPTGNVYPLSCERTLAQIDAAIQANYNVIGICNIGGVDTPQAQISSTAYNGQDGALSMVSFTILGLVGGTPTMGTVIYDSYGATLTMTPLSTAQMTYDSGTGTLAITE